MTSFVEHSFHFFVMNFSSGGGGGVSKGTVLCGVVDAGYGLGRSLGDCRPVLSKGRNHQLVKTQTVPR